MTEHPGSPERTDHPTDDLRLRVGAPVMAPGPESIVSTPTGDSEPPGSGDRRRLRTMYLRFGAMIATSTAVMFVLMYLNTYAWDHVRWSETRFYMAFVMGSAMAAIMLLFMLGMYKSKVVNVAILLTSAVVFSTSLWLVRSQTTVQDQSYMRAMIPHHSIAILTSERSELTDLRVLELANDIILAQRREIDEMDWLIDDIEANGEVTTEAELAERPVPDFTATNGRDELASDLVRSYTKETPPSVTPEWLERPRGRPR